MLDLLSRRARVGAAVVVMTAAAVTVSACSSGGHDMGTMPGMSTPSATAMSAMPGMDPSMPGMDHAMPVGDGRTATVDGYTLTLSAPEVTPAARSLQLRITTGASTLTAFAEDQTKRMHLYLIRSDLSGFQHVHPRMAADGTWTAPLSALAPGRYRVYASFIPNAGPAVGATMVLGAGLSVPGSGTDTPLPPASPTATVDGYTVAVSGRIAAGVEAPLSVTITRNGEPVTDLQPYLDSYAHLTAVHAGDLAFAHLHPQGTVSGAGGGPTLTFAAMLPRPGAWRLFLQFQTAGVLHTAAVTLAAAG